MSKPGTKAVPDIFIIEDDQRVRRALERAFVGEGYTVATACDGEQALQNLVRSDSPPKVIILDLMMPVMDGWKLRRYLLEQPRWAQIPVIVFSGVGDISDETLPAVVCIPKPVHLRTLFENVARLIAGTAAHRLN